MLNTDAAVSCCSCVMGQVEALMVTGTYTSVFANLISLLCECVDLCDCAVRVCFASSALQHPVGIFELERESVCGRLFLF